MRRRSFVVVAAVSMSLLGLELVWTRLFSAEFFYTYAFLVLSLAIMGLGLGALSLRLFPSLGKERNLGIILSLATMAMLAGPPLVFYTGLNFVRILDDWSMVWRLLLVTVLLGVPFFFGGIALAVAFRRNHRDMPRLYMVDLICAGAGVLLAIALMNNIGTPPATFLVALPMLAGALFVSRRWTKVAPALLIIPTIILVICANGLLEAKRGERAPVIYTHWDAMSKIKIQDFDVDYRGLNIDNVANSPVYRFDGNWDRPPEAAFEFGIDVSNLIKRFDSCTFLSLGAGGGADVLQALQAGATEIHAVEVNAHINELMLEGSLAKFSGRIYSDPRVHVATEDARAYVRRHPNKFDVIYSLSSNSWAALASGSFALAESYLFTTEAFQDYWRSLTDDGFMMIEHQYYIPRLVSAVTDALRAEGIPEPLSHFAVYHLPEMRRKMILLSKQPLTDEIRNSAFGELTPEKHEAIHLLYPAADSAKDNLANRIVLEGWRAVADSAPVNITPSTDDQPFVGQMGLWRNLKWEKPEKLFGLGVFGFPLSQVILVIILAVALVFALPLTLLPYLVRGPKLRAAPWLYFFMIGAAFMGIEAVLIQKYSLLVGPSPHCLITILIVLLVTAGAGSRISAHVNQTAVFLAIVAWVVVDATVYPYIARTLAPMTLSSRILAAALLVAPLGLFMGMPFPKGAKKVGSLVDWALAVNGVASVLGSTAIIFVAMTFGFRIAMLTAAVLYLAAYVLLSRESAWRSAWPGTMEAFAPAPSDELSQEMSPPMSPVEHRPVSTGAHHAER